MPIDPETHQYSPGKVVARFYVSSMTKRASAGQNREFELYPVTRGPENKTWAAATPSGQIKMTVNNPSAADWFESMLGRDVAITFEARPMVCSKCKEEIRLDQYGAVTDNGDGTYQHYEGHCPGWTP